MAVEPTAPSTGGQLDFCDPLRSSWEFHLGPELPEEPEAAPAEPEAPPATPGNLVPFIVERTNAPEGLIDGWVQTMLDCIADAYQLRFATREDIARTLRDFIPAFAALTAEDLPILLAEVLPNFPGPWFPVTATDEEVLIWMVLIAETTYIERGISPEALATAIEATGDTIRIVQQEAPEITFGLEGVLWADVGLRQTPKPSADLLITVSSWIWGCTPEVIVAEDGLNGGK